MKFGIISKSARVDMFITIVPFIPSCSTIESLSWSGIYNKIVLLPSFKVISVKQYRVLKALFTCLKKRNEKLSIWWLLPNIAKHHVDCPSHLSCCSKNQMTKKCKNVQSSRPDSHFKIKFFKKYLTCRLDCSVLEFFVLWLT